MDVWFYIEQEPTAEKHERELKNPSMASQGFHKDFG
jgi:hypothetical protein